MSTLPAGVSGADAAADVVVVRYPAVSALGAVCRPRSDCRVCSSSNLHTVLDLQSQPLANAYLPLPLEQMRQRGDQRCDAFPLRLNVCADCFHMQLSHVVRPDILFSHYLYASGTNRTISAYFTYLRDRIDADWTVGESSRQTDRRSGPQAEGRKKSILEIASNDATQLDLFHEKGWQTTGVDPAANLIAAVHARPGGHPHRLVCDFWSRRVASEAFPSEVFDVVLAQNVFAHVDDTKEFCLAAKQVMHDDSQLIIQTSQCHMIQNNEFDTIYHEHLSFFTVLSMQRQAEACGLFLTDVTIVDIHGDSFLFTLSKRNEPRPSVQREMDKERREGLYSLSCYTAYADACRAVVRDLVSTVRSLAAQGWRCIGYGAAAKGMTLLNFAGLTRGDLSYIVDDAPLKQGLYTPGSDVPIVPATRLMQEAKDAKIVILPLAWNFFAEIRQRVQERLAATPTVQAAFIRYFPKVEIIHESSSSSSVPSGGASSSLLRARQSSTLFAGCVLSGADQTFADARGLVTRVAAPPSSSYHQILLVQNRAHVLRGMHFAAYAKSVSVLTGSIVDVIVDLRVGSATYGQWHQLTLSADAASGRPSSLLIPGGFAHGYYSDAASTLVYGISAAQADEVRFSPFDAQLNIAWPMDIAQQQQQQASVRPIMNEADAAGVTLSSVEQQIADKQKA